MALSIVNNLTAFKAQEQLRITGDALSKSLSHLSSGERIQSAADDPSGLAISERLRTQIRGLSRASANAQDGKSMLQTAEGSLGEDSSILQRMRELAVQAANGVLTASDRQELQREVDQLKGELDRIGKNTEFNTKKLLDGSATGLWSSNSASLSAIITGAVTDRNYKLDVSADVGTNQVLKTDIMRIADGKIGVTDDGAPAQVKFNLADVTGTGSASLTLGVGSDTITVSFTGGQFSTAALQAEYIVNAINADSSNDGRVEAAVGPDSGDILIRATATGSTGDTYTIKWDTATAGGAVTTWAAGALTHTFTGSSGVALSTFSGVEGGSGNTDSTVVNRIYDPAGLAEGAYNVTALDNTLHGAISEAGYLLGAFQGPTSDAYLSSIGNLSLSQNHYVIAEVIGEGASGTVDLRVSWDQGQNWQSLNNYTNGDVITSGTDTFSMTFAGSGNLKVGDKFLIGLQNDVAAANDMVRLEGPAGSFTNLQTPSTSGILRDDYQYVNPGLWVDTAAADASNTNGHILTTAVMDSSGNVSFGQVTMDFGTFAATSQATQNVTINGAGGVAGADTKLQDVDRFYDNNGNFILGSGGKWIDMYDGNGNKASIFIEGSDTLREVAGKLAEAIGRDVTTQGWTGLNMGEVKDDSGDSKNANFVQSASGGDEAVAGTIVIRSSKTGLDGRLFFSADEDLMKALSLATIQEATNGSLTVDVSDAHTGDKVGSDTTGDYTLHNVITGLEVKFDPTAGVTAAWDATAGKITFTAADQSYFLHVVQNSTNFQIGANEGQMMSAYIGQMDTKALGVDSALVVNQDTATEAITMVDDAIQKVSSERARLGAYLNRLDHTINNLAVQEENQTAAESTIRDLNMAKAISEMTQQQILQQVSTAMLAQANALPQSILTLLR
jgi:flagellin